MTVGHPGNLSPASVDPCKKTLPARDSPNLSRLRTHDCDRNSSAGVASHSQALIYVTFNAFLEITHNSLIFTEIHLHDCLVGTFTKKLKLNICVYICTEDNVGYPYLPSPPASKALSVTGQLMLLKR